MDDDAATAGVGEGAALDIAGLGGVLAATFGEVTGVSTTGGSLELTGEMKAGRAARVGADLNPSKTTMAVMVLSVARTGRFTMATRASQLEGLSVDTPTWHAAAHERAQCCVSHRGRPAQIHVVVPQVGYRLHQPTGR